MAPKLRGSSTWSRATSNGGAVGAACSVDSVDAAGVTFREVATFSASFSCSMLLQRSNRYEVVGSAGSIEVPTAFVPGNTDVVLRVSDRSGATEVVVPGVDQYRLEVEHFSKCILDGTSLTYPAENGLANMRTIDAVRSSSLTS